MLMTVKTVMTIIQTLFFFWNFRLGEILDRQFRKYRTKLYMVWKYIVIINLVY